MGRDFQSGDLLSQNHLRNDGFHFGDHHSTVKQLDFIKADNIILIHGADQFTEKEAVIHELKTHLPKGPDPQLHKIFRIDQLDRIRCPPGYIQLGLGIDEIDLCRKGSIPAVGKIKYMEQDRKIIRIQNIRARIK